MLTLSIRFTSKGGLMIHFAERGFTRIGWWESSTGATANSYWATCHGRGVESWPDLSRARGACAVAREFYGRHGVDADRQVWRFYGQGFVRVE